MSKTVPFRKTSTPGNQVKLWYFFAVRSFDLIKEHCMDDNVLKKFISICTDEASTNIRFNDSLFTHLAEEYSYAILFWCIVFCCIISCCWLLSDMKNWLMKLYYLSNKNTKKLRSLKELIDELDSLVDLTDNFVQDDVVTSIRNCGTR